MEDRGPASFFLGVQILRDRAKKTLFLQQPQYIDQAVETFGLADAKPLSVPLQPNAAHLALFELKALGLLDPKNHRLFQQIIGTLMYLMLLTRPNIAFSV